MEPKILYIAPLKDFSGYSSAARNYVRALDSVGCNIVTRSVSYDGGNYKQTVREKELSRRDLQNVSIVIQQLTPNENERKDGVFNINYFAWETDRVPQEWVERLNRMDLVLVPCDENVKAARLGGVVVPVVKIPHTFDTSSYYQRTPFDINGAEEHFKLLSICQVSKKKGLDILLKSYFSEFCNGEQVLLILKTYFGPQDGEEHKKKMEEQIGRIKESLRLPSYPQVLLVHGIMDDEGIARLYSTSDCYSLTARGEGWSIPHFDAMGFGLPPIATRWGGPSEFITSKTGWLVDYTMGPCHDMPHPHPFMYTGRDNWAEPSADSLQKALREAYQEWQVWKKTGQGAWLDRKRACIGRVKDFSYEKVGGQMRDVIEYYWRKWK